MNDTIAVTLVTQNATFDAYAGRKTRTQGRGRPRKDKTK